MTFYYNFLTTVKSRNNRSETFHHLYSLMPVFIFPSSFSSITSMDLLSYATVAVPSSTIELRRQPIIKGKGTPRPNTQKFTIRTIPAIRLTLVPSIKISIIRR
ncbi:hypothetical protein ABFX02_01G113900 [Erythranthe guttata]